MTDYQLVLIELLKEFNQICDKHGWAYYATQEYSLEAYRSNGFENKKTDLSVRMPAEDFLAFVLWAEGNLPEDRFVESMWNNPKFPRVAAYYGNTETLDFSTVKWKNYDHYGIHMNIEPIRYLPSNKSTLKLKKVTESVWETYADPVLAGKNRDRACKAMARLAGVMGRDKLAKRVFRYCVDTKYAKTEYLYTKRRWRTKTKLYDAALFSDYIEIPFETTVLRIPADYETYLSDWKGEDWEEFDLSERTYNPVRRLVDASIPYAEYLEALKQEGIDEDDVWKTKKQYDAVNRKLVVLRKRRTKQWNRLFLTSDRYYYWDMYHNSKLYVQELIKSGKAEEVIEYLNPYIEAMFEHNKKGLGLCFDTDIFECVVEAYKMLGNEDIIERMERIRRRIPEAHLKKVKIRDHLGDEVEETNMSGFRKATVEVVPAILEYLKRNVGDCVYMYVDIAKYGLDNPNMDVWYDSNDKGISLVVMKYYDSIQVFTEEEEWDVKSVSKLVSEYRPGMVSGKRQLIEKLYPENEADYNLEIGYVFKLTNFMKFDDMVPIQRVGVEKCPEIARFICTNDSIGGYYDVDDLTKQLTERIETGIGRSLVILGEDGEMKGHIASYAEFDGIATTAGLLAVDDGSGIPYGTMLESRLIYDLLDEGFDIYTFVTEDRRAKFFKVMKCEELNRYGKMTLKK